MIDPRIQYVNEPGFMHVQRPSQSNGKYSFTKKKDLKVAKKLALK